QLPPDAVIEVAEIEGAALAARHEDASQHGQLDLSAGHLHRLGEAAERALQLRLRTRAGKLADQTLPDEQPLPRRGFRKVQCVADAAQERLIEILLLVAGGERHPDEV